MNAILSILFAVVAVAYCEPSNYTVTDEAWFDVEIKDMDGPGEDYHGRFEIALFGEAAPITTFNFRSIAKGYKLREHTFTYKNSYVHSIVRDFMVQMGDITIGDGSGVTSIYGAKFNDESFKLSHRSPGWVAMANHGIDTNGSQFYIMLQKSRWLDDKHVVFGKVIRGYNVVKAIGELDTNEGSTTPKKIVKITNCGLNKLEKPYELNESERDSIEDL